MAYPTPFMRLALSGPLYAAEQWSFSLTLVDNDWVTGTTGPAEVPSGIVDACTTFFHGPGISSNAKLSMIKYNMLDVEGHYVDVHKTVLHEVNPALAGGNSGSIAPQMALAMSLGTGAARGLAHAGRFYLPVPAEGIAEDGRLTVVQATAYATRATTFLNAINAASGNWRVGVVSKIRTGDQRVVTNVRVGRVIDTIRSRRTSLAEGYVVGETLTAP